MHNLTPLGTSMSLKELDWPRARPEHLLLNVKVKAQIEKPLRK